MRTLPRLTAVAAAGTMLLLPTVAHAASPVADTIFRNGKVYTAEKRSRSASAVAVRQGRIVYVGNDAGARRYSGRGTKTIDLHGRMLMPGLQDGHMHPTAGGADLLKCSLDYAPLTVEQIKARIAACVRKAPDDGSWIQVAAWYQEAMIPVGSLLTAADLDQVSATRPIRVVSSFGHSSVLNTPALKLAKVTAATPDPAGGSIGHDAAGNPNGIFNDAASSLGAAALRAPTKADYVAAAAAATKAMREQGITSFLDAAAEDESIAAFHTLQRQGKLTARAHFASEVGVTEGRKPKQVVARLKKLKRRYDQGPIAQRPTITVRNAKLFMDGVQQVPGQTAGLLAPYLVNAGDADHPHWVPGTKTGEVYFDDKELQPLVTAISEAGFDPHLHAIGDRAVRHSLDAVEYMRKRVKTDIRPALAHTEMVDPADYGRFRKLDAIPVMSFQWAKPGPDSIDAQKDYIGPERFGRVEPEGSLLKAGARLTYGSDWPVDVLNDWLALQIGITRENPAGGKYAGPFNDEPGMSRRDALQSITANSAYELHQDDQTGTLRPGKLADLIVLDQNVLRVPATKIGDTKVLLTMVGGKTVYRSGALR